MIIKIDEISKARRELKKYPIGPFTPFVKEDRRARDAYILYDTLYVPCMYEFFVALYYANDKPMDIEEFAKDASEHAMNVVKDRIDTLIDQAKIDSDERIVKWGKSIHGKRIGLMSLNFLSKELIDATTAMQILSRAYRDSMIMQEMTNDVNSMTVEYLNQK